MSTTDFIKQVQNKEIDVVEHTHKVLEEIKKINKEYNYFNTISEELALEQAKSVKKNPKGRLAGLPVSVKDCIVVKGVESRAGSKILSGYKPVFDATVIEKVKAEGAIIIGKTAQDEFGFGGFSVNVGVGMKIPLNPFDKNRACGGSSGGAAGIAQKISFPHIAIGESTGGSIVNPASFCGVVGLCPTYGRVSRYGLMDYANSLDKIGAIGKTVEETAMMLSVISGFDEKDSTSINKPAENYENVVGKIVKNMKIGVIKESLEEGTDKEIKSDIIKAVKGFEELGVKHEEISLPLTMKYGVEAYYLTAMSETSTNLAKFCGMRYGKHEKLEGGFNQYFSKVRSANFGEEAKRRVIIGTFARMAGFRDAYYIKAAQVRTKIIEEYKKAFKKVDCLVSPTMPVVAPKFSEIKKLTPLQNYMMDILTVGPNLAGLPHVTVPCGIKDGMPVGLMLVGNHLMEGKLLQLAAAYEQK
ncbi:Asp-tRNA(Asn)/Glu-tRNA(Gln) amidotransferase subunit GatA [Candidatus Woesearchaeota archaeon]|nr:Asp-tRNA(Asn)/Glu-tRNA(Gln) amidotransferase subunit GatA [Candidatus Woesearchaeota archaeon]